MDGDENKDAINIPGLLLGFFSYNQCRPMLDIWENRCGGIQIRSDTSSIHNKLHQLLI